MDIDNRFLVEAAPDVSDATADAPDPAAALISWHDMHGEGGADRRTILVVDDDATIRLLLRKGLEGALRGFDIVTVAGPMEALDFLADGAGRTAKIFTDNQMPGEMTGVDFARALRGDLSCAKLPDTTVAELRRVPISLVTGDADTSEADSLRKSGTLHAVVKKPFTIKDIVHGVTVAVNRLREIQVTA